MTSYTMKYPKHIVQETITNPQHGYSPEVLQQILPPMFMMKDVTKFMVLKFQADDLIDEELSNLLCSESDQFSIAQQQNSITQENREKLERTIHTTREKIKNLLLLKQLEPEIAKTLLPILLLDKHYLGTISNSQ